MFLQNFRPFYYTSFLIFIFQALHADLTVTINQVAPYPPMAVCGSSGVPVQVGGTVSYAITIQNTGTGPIRGFTLTDTLSSDVNPGGVCFCNVVSCGDDYYVTYAGNSFTIYSHATVNPGESLTFTATFKVCTGLNPNGFSTLTNTATVSSTNSVATAFITSSATITSCVQGCALAVTALPSVNTSVCINQSVTLNALVKCSCSNQITYSWYYQDGTLIQTGASPELVLSQGFAQGYYYVTAEDGLTGCSATSYTGTITTIPCADLAIQKTVSVQNKKYTFTIQVTNNGPSASLVTVTDCIPSYLRVTELLPLNGSNWQFTQNNERLTAILVDGSNNPLELQPQTSASFQIVTQKNIFYTKKVCNTATVTGSVFDPNLCNNTSTVKIAA